MKARRSHANELREALRPAVAEFLSTVADLVSDVLSGSPAKQRRWKGPHKTWRNYEVAATYLGIEPGTLTNWRTLCKAGQPPFTKLSRSKTRRVIYDNEDLDA